MPPTINVRVLKFGTNFDFIDTDRDGITRLQDWEEFADYLCSQFGESIDSPAGNQVRQAVLGWWYQILGEVDGDDDRRLSRAEFAVYYGNRTEEQLGAIIRPYIDAVFALCDGDSDGRLARWELAGLLRVHGVPERELTQTMAHMVPGDSGYISKDAYTDLVLDFWLNSDAQSPGCWHHGRT